MDTEGKKIQNTILVKRLETKQISNNWGHNRIIISKKDSFSQRLPEFNLHNNLLNIM